MSNAVEVLSLVIVIANLYLKLPYESLIKRGFKNQWHQSFITNSLKIVLPKCLIPNLINGINHRRSDANYINSYGGVSQLRFHPWGVK